MKVIFSGGVLVFVAIVGWRIGGELSPDALGMAVGILFGIMAGIPTALILLASQRRAGERRDERPRVIEPQRQIVEVHHHYYVDVAGGGQMLTQGAVRLAAAWKSADNESDLGIRWGGMLPK